VCAVMLPSPRSVKLHSGPHAVGPDDGTNVAHGGGVQAVAVSGGDQHAVADLDS